MASCSTPQWSGDYTPQVTLTVTQQSSTDTQVVLAWTLKYVTHGYTANTNGNGRSYSVTIDGDSVKTGTFDINDESTTTIASGTKTVDKSTSSRNVSFSCSFDFDITWSDVYGGTKTASGSISIGAKTSYKVSFNANGGSGAPSAQTKWHGTSLTLSSTKPTRTGYTFEGWALSQSEANSGDWYYQAGGTCGKNENLTLYAVWTEHCLTISYYSNYATSAFADAENTVGADKNVRVSTSKIYYDNDYSTYGLANYSNSGGAVYMTRTGYTATKYWGTSTSGGTLIGENDTSYTTGQSLAKKLGKDLSDGNANINLYAQWSENKLTVNLYSNYADYATYQGEALDVSLNTNVIVYTKDYFYDNAYSTGLSDIQNAEYLYLSKTGHKSTEFWGTSPSGGTLINEKNSYSSGQELAEEFGLSLKTGNASINLYAQWEPNVLTIKYHINGGVINSDKYYIDNNLVGLISSSAVLEDKWNYNGGHADGLYNAKTFGLSREGYKFIGWKVGSSGTTIFDQDDPSIVPTDLASNLTTGDRTVTLYAVWEISGVVYIYNGTTFEPYLAYIDNGTNWDLYIAYIDNGTDWDTIS